MPNEARTLPDNLEAIVLISRIELRPIFRKALGDSGFATIETPSTIDDCNVLLGKHPEAFLIFDMDSVSIDKIKLLQDAKSKGRTVIDRPVLLISKEENSDVVDVALEYGVYKIHQGMLTPAVIEKISKEMIEEKFGFLSIRSQLREVNLFSAKEAFEEAERCLVELFEKFPNEPLIQAEWINVLIQQNKWREAFKVAIKLTTLFPDYIRGFHLLGRCQMKNGDYEGAVKTFTKASFINPYDVERLVELGNTLLQLNKVEEAQGKFEKALEVNPDYEPAARGVGTCKLLQGNINEVLGIVSSFSSDREVAAMFNDAGVISIRNKDFQEGMQLYRAASSIAQLSDDLKARLFFNMGLAFYKWDRGDDAILAFEEAVRFDPTYEKARANIDILKKGLKAPRPMLQDMDDDDSMLDEAI